MLEGQALLQRVGWHVLRQDVLKELTFTARIVFLCDSFDAMTSGRPYRVNMSAEAALAELRAHTGTQFDPALVEIFCADHEPGATAG